MATDGPARSGLKARILFSGIVRHAPSVAPSVAPSAEPKPSSVPAPAPDTPGSPALAAINTSLDDLWFFSIPNRIVPSKAYGGWLAGSFLTSLWPLTLNAL